MDSTKVDPKIRHLTTTIIDRFGVSMSARATGAKRPQNAASWKRNGNIPLKYRAGFLRIGERLGLPFSPIELAYLQSTEKVPSERQLIEDLARAGQ